MSGLDAPSEARVRARAALTRGKSKESTRTDDVEIPGQMSIWDVIEGTEQQGEKTR